MGRILGIAGSPRKGGNSDILLEYILRGAEKEGAEIYAAYLRDYQFQSCIGCEICRRDGICTGLDDDMQLLYPVIKRSQGLVLVSPTHHYNITAKMKAFIDRLYCFYVFTPERPGAWHSKLAAKGRKAVPAAVCEQNDMKDMGFTLEAMRLPLEALGYQVMGEMAVTGMFDKGKVRGKPEMLVEAESLGKALADAMGN